MTSVLGFSSIPLLYILIWTFTLDMVYQYQNPRMARWPTRVLPDSLMHCRLQLQIYCPVAVS